MELPDGVALAALGGYGRGELAPHSDLDLLLTYRKRLPDDLPDRIWYPIWDAGVKLGHAVRSVRDTLKLAKDDLDTATALLDVRCLLGDERVAEELSSDARQRWRRNGRTWLRTLAAGTTDRHRRHDDVAFAIEPDLKHGRGGLRDAQTIRWAQLAGAEVDLDLGDVPAAVETLTAARVALHLVTDRASDRLMVESIDEVAQRVGAADRDELMGRVAAAGRTIAWITDEVVYDAVEHPDVRVDDPSVEASRGRVRFRTPGPRDGEAALHLAVVAAHHGLRISRPALDEVAAGTTPELRWTPTMRALLVSLLAAGRSAIPVVEALDHVGIWTTLLPEWTPARSRPQHNPYHGFTVDRHLLETVAVAATLPCHRPDLLLLGALLHDLGKAYPGDHSDAGAELAGPLLGRIGLTPDEAETVQLLVRHHLLLPDTATRRDLDDPATLDRVAAIVQRGDRLDLLASLAVADGRATGPTAWSDWKAKLVAELVRRVHVVLAGSTPGDVVSGTPFTAATLEHARAAPGEVVVRGAGETLVVSAPDQPGLFSRITGAVALHGLDIRSARITCVEGTAVDELEVSSPFGEIRWERVEGDVRRAVTGRLAITARLAERAQAYPRRHLAHTLPPEVRIIDGTDPQSAIVEVVGPDSPGLLYRLSRAFAELGLDITRAMASTVGHDVVDAFYVHDPGAFGLADEASRNELRLALRHALTAAEA